MSKWNLNSLAAACITATLATPALAQTPIWSAEETLSAVQNDEVLLLDIRRPNEWEKTGLAEGALPVSMHDPEFGKNLQAILTKFSGKPIAMICATGGRTEYVTGILAKNGLTGVIDVSEGMMGNQRGKGWLAKDLPIVDRATAQAAYETLLAE